MSKLLKIFAALALIVGAFVITFDTASAQRFRGGGGGFRAVGMPGGGFRGFAGGYRGYGGMRVAGWRGGPYAGARWRGGMRVAGWRGGRWYGGPYAAARWRGGGWYGRRWHDGRWYARRYWGPGWGWGWGAAGLGLAAATWPYYYGDYYGYPYYGAYGAYAAAPNCGYVRVRVLRKGKYVLRRAWRCW